MDTTFFQKREKLMPAFLKGWDLSMDSLLAFEHEGQSFKIIKSWKMSPEL